MARVPGKTTNPAASRGLPWFRSAVAGAVVFGAAALLFARLGNYAFWDDEAMTALVALGVWRTGDTTAVVDHNIVAFRDGSMLSGLYERCSPPLPSYVAAPFLGILGRNAQAGRIPFAVCGLACVILIVRRAWLERVDPTTWVLWTLAILGNVSFFLYCRQCRYYGLAMLLSVAIVDLALHRGGRRTLAMVALLSIGLLATNPMNYVALYVCLGLDHLVWGRREAPMSRRDWLLLWLPQVIAGGLILAIWNPYRGTAFNFPRPENWWAAKATLLWWNLRDLNACEFGVGALLVLAPFFGKRDPRGPLARAVVGLAVYVVVMTLISPQPVALTRRADVRYLSPAIPLCMAIGVLALRELGRSIPRAGFWPLAVLAFATNILHGGFVMESGVRSTVASFIGELLEPPGDPYRPTARWINANVPDGCSVWVEPDYMTYPLMFHAPGPIYAWQFPLPPTRRDLPLAPIQYRGLVPPDYIVAFGPFVKKVRKELRFPTGSNVLYKQIDTIDFFWLDRFRPELYWHLFQPVKQFDRQTQAIYLFERISPPAGRAGMFPNLEERPHGTERPPSN